MHKFIVRGTRGSVPACGRRFLKYGGNTSCFSLETDEGLIILDAGTGLAEVDADIAARPQLPPMTVLFTHFHLDHISGLPCFSPLYNDQASIEFMGDPDRDDDWKQTLKHMVSPPYWPTDLESTSASLTFTDLPNKIGHINVYGVDISWCPVFHPQGCLAYRLEGPDNVIVLATDHEHAPSDVSAGFLEFCQGADIIIYDAMYTPEEYPAHSGWGHGNWHQGVQLALEAGARQLVLTHHNATRTDAEIDEMVRLSRVYFPETYAAMENMVLQPAAAR
jgi:phosphoribosyl 1,2-cyclic phosphodiesterase